MSLEFVAIISLLVLCGIFLIATFLPIHMGALAISAAFVLGIWLLPGGFSPEALDEKSGAIADGFPGDLFITLAGVTFLFGIAKNNGTVDWLVHAAVQSVGGRVALIPWVFFGVTAVLTGIGAVVPAAVAIIAPIGMTFARRYGIRQLLMGLMVINGATAGGFSPLSIFGSITNDVVAGAGLDGSPLFLFLASLVFNVVLGVVTFVLFGGTRLMGVRDAGEGVLVASDGSTVSAGGVRQGPAEQTGQRGTSGSSASPNAEPGSEPVTTLDLHRGLTLAGMIVLTLGAFFLQLDVGFFSFLIGSLLCLVNPSVTRGAVREIAWPTVLLVCGIVTYVSLLQNPALDPAGERDVITWLGDWAAGLGAVTIAALLILYVGGVVSAFASTTGILGALIPLAVPFLDGPDAVLGVVALVTALAISSSVVDSSPYSTSGALVVANANEADRDKVYKSLLKWGFSMVAIAPFVTWLLLIVIGNQALDLPVLR
ncbi:SLC13 family permease [Nocardioides sp. GXQ0305]|uniref:SLC13 family permease n=1 Tax=Nocardioides sp. GXQ0305 TaxID=3423912 RepID=UPI003D7E6069